MKEELDKELCAKYPQIFVDRRAPASQSCMHWGIAVGDGWYNIIDQLCGAIQWHINQRQEQIQTNKEYADMRTAALAGDWTLFNKHYDRLGLHKPDWLEKRRKEVLEEIPEWRKVLEPIPQVVAAQVKEKFGTLRFYYDGGDSTIEGMVTLAEGMSSVTCEECGAPGVLRSGGWVRTLCDAHEKEDKNHG